MKVSWYFRLNTKLPVYVCNLREDTLLLMPLAEFRWDTVPRCPPPRSAAYVYEGARPPGSCAFRCSVSCAIQHEVIITQT